jgi:hypothetical protein
MSTTIASPGVPGKGFDCSVKVNALQARAFYGAGYRWCARYVRLPNNSAALDIDAAEMAVLLEAGLAVLLVQHVRASAPGSGGWDISKHSGADDAAAAVEHARNAGYPLGAHVFLDLEDILAGPGAGVATKVFAEAWAAAVRAAGYQAGCYVGFDVPLNAQELYLLHGINSYWSDAGHRAVATRGCAIQQGKAATVAGVEIDEDTLLRDLLGELPLLATSQPDAAAA